MARNAAAAIEDAQHAVQVGRVLEELNYRWYEETLSDRGLPYLKKRCATLDVSVLALESLMYGPRSFRGVVDLLV